MITALRTLVTKTSKEVQNVIQEAEIVKFIKLHSLRRYVHNDMPNNQTVPKIRYCQNGRNKDNRKATETME